MKGSRYDRREDAFRRLKEQVEALPLSTTKRSELWAAIFSYADVIQRNALAILGKE